MTLTTPAIAAEPCAHEETVHRDRCPECGSVQTLDMLDYRQGRLQEPQWRCGNCGATPAAVSWIPVRLCNCGEVIDE